ncbi:hypothetical protein FRC01_011569 [Tulasnella sp. 417]|nr:hypothetical protein FRC01_011569 [Tulasnella sp. 417]
MTGNICVYCPGGPDSDFDYSTQSYTGYEPTSMRAIRARYDPYEQTRGRVEQLKALGHSTDKVEFIIMGGTFMSMPEDYRNKFIAQLHNALSGYTGLDVDDAVRFSEQSKSKAIGITIETRPDYCLRPHLSQMLRYGCTRLEIGVQSVYEDVARDTNRGHTVRAVSESFHLGKDAGFKIVAHMMPDLPNVGVERDMEQFKEYFENPAFRSDGLKIYPTLVIRGTGLYELWRTGRYKNYTPNVLVDVVARILADIPLPLVTSGCENSGNLRELALQRMKDFGAECRDVRFREVGIHEIHHKVRPEAVELIRRDYTANGGWETFLSYEDPERDILVGLLRLRRCSDEGTFRPELVKSEKGRVSIVRELHVYGTAVPVHGRDPTKFQHQGFGTLLMEEAERIAKEEHGSYKLAVIAAMNDSEISLKKAVYGDAHAVPTPVPAPAAAPRPDPTPKLFGMPLKYVSLVTLAIQNAALAIMMHYSRVSTAPSKTYSAGAAVLLNELLKGSISLIIALMRTEPDTPRTRIATASVPTASKAEYTLLAKSKRAVAAASPPALLRATTRLVGRFRKLGREVFSADCWKLSIPAILYVIQNNLQFVAASNLDVATFQVTYQMKILTTAGFSVLMLRKKLSTVKWLSLLGLAIGVGVVQIQTGAAAHGGGSGDSIVKHVMNPMKGFLAVSSACVTSGLAGVYFEMVLKGSQSDLWVRNVQLSLFSLLPALVPVFFNGNSTSASSGD